MNMVGVNTENLATKITNIEDLKENTEFSSSF